MEKDVKAEELLSILHSDNAAAMKSVLLRTSDATELLLTEVKIPFSEDVGQESLTFLQEHSTLLEVAFCTLAARCVHLLLATETEASLGITGKACPLHCLVSQLAMVQSDSGRQEVAVEFLEQLRIHHLDFLLRCMDCEASGYNALEWAVTHRQFRVAHWILSSPRYLTDARFSLGWQEARLDLSDYSFPWGDRLYRNPLSTAAELVGVDINVSEELKRFMDSKIISAWSEYVTGKYCRLVLSKILLTLFSKALFLICGCVAIYRTIYFGASYRQALSGNWSQNCAMLRVFHTFSSSESVYYLVNVLAFGSAIVLSLEALAVLLSVIISMWVSKSGTTRWRLVLDNTLFEPKFTLSLLFLLSNALMVRVYDRSTPMDYIVAPANPEHFWKHSGDSACSLSVVNSADWLVIIICWTTLVATALEWTQVDDRMCLVWKTAGAYQYFGLAVFLTIVLCSWVIGSMVPCEPSFLRASDNKILSIWSAVYKTLVFSTMTSASHDRLGVFSMLMHVFFCLFLFNFMIAIMADRISTISRNLRYVALANRLSVLFACEFSLAWALRKLPGRRPTRKKILMIRVLEY